MLWSKRLLLTLLLMVANIPTAQASYALIGPSQKFLLVADTLEVMPHLAQVRVKIRWKTRTASFAVDTLHFMAALDSNLPCTGGATKEAVLNALGRLRASKEHPVVVEVGVFGHGLKMSDDGPADPGTLVIAARAADGPATQELGAVGWRLYEMRERRDERSLKASIQLTETEPYYSDQHRLAVLTLSSLHEERGESDAAKRLLQKLIVKKKDAKRPQYYLGTDLRRYAQFQAGHGDLGGAIATSWDAIAELRASGDDGNALLALRDVGIFYSKQRQFVLARRCLERSILEREKKEKFHVSSGDLHGYLAVLEEGGFSDEATTVRKQLEMMRASPDIYWTSPDFMKLSLVGPERDK